MLVAKARLERFHQVTRLTAATLTVPTSSISTLNKLSFVIVIRRVVSESSSQKTQTKKLIPTIARENQTLRTRIYKIIAVIKTS